MRKPDVWVRKNRNGNFLYSTLASSKSGKGFCIVSPELLDWVEKVQAALVKGASRSKFGGPITWAEGGMLLDELNAILPEEHE